MRRLTTAILASTILASLNFEAAAETDLRVVTSIKPVHSLVASVMQGVGVPVLLLEGTASPHSYSLKPSQAQHLQAADIIFWMGHDLEAFLDNAIDSIAANSVSVPLTESHGLIRLKTREGGAFDSHDHAHDDHDESHDDHDAHNDHHDSHDDHQDHADHKDHDHGDHNDHKDHDGHDHHDEHDNHKDHDHGDHNDHKDHDRGDHDHGDHKRSAFDSHLWLDPQNAKVMVHEIEEQLTQLDPAHAAIYEANAALLMAELDDLTAEIDAELAPVKGKGFVVFHDAYQYFEKRFDMAATGSVTVSPEVLPGAERIRELQAKIQALDVACIFAEPQFEPKLVATIIENTGTKTGVIDPLGATIADGPQLYSTLIRNMAASLKDCLISAD